MVSPYLRTRCGSPTTPSARLPAAAPITDTGVRSSCDTAATNSICCRARSCARRADTAINPIATRQQHQDAGADDQVARAHRRHRGFERARRDASPSTPSGLSKPQLAGAGDDAAARRRARSFALDHRHDDVVVRRAGSRDAGSGQPGIAGSRLPVPGSRRTAAAAVAAAVDRRAGSARTRTSDPAAAP